MSLRIRLAESPEDRDAVFQLRHRVFVEEKHWFAPRPDGRIVDRFDAFPDVANLVAVVDGRVVGGARVVGDCPLGTPADAWFDFSPFLPPGARPASVSMVCLEPQLRRTSGPVSAMLGMAEHWCLARGFTHIVAPANPDAAQSFLRTGARAVAPEFIDPGTGLPVVPLVLDFGALDRRFFDFAQRQGIVHVLDSFERQFHLAGETVIHQGDAGASAFVVIAGEVEVIVRRDSSPPMEVARLGRGELFGEMALLTSHPRSSDVVAVTDVELMVLDRDAFLSQVQSEPGAAMGVLAMLGCRLAETDNRLPPRRFSAPLQPV